MAVVLLEHKATVGRPEEVLLAMLRDYEAHKLRVSGRALINSLNSASTRVMNQPVSAAARVELPTRVQPVTLQRPLSTPPLLGVATATN